MAIAGLLGAGEGYPCLPGGGGAERAGAEDVAPADQVVEHRGGGGERRVGRRRAREADGEADRPSHPLIRRQLVDVAAQDLVGGATPRRGIPREGERRPALDG